MLAKVVFKKHTDSAKLAMVVIIHHPPILPQMAHCHPRK